VLPRWSSAAPPIANNARTSVGRLTAPKISAVPATTEAIRSNVVIFIAAG